ncbi:FAS-associated factor 2-like [Watersipora subatra]|uniref:FAS-associated factor 2-like n=1 Tax=Watersipora subatra TaxID=2589382 RepID=UPI00355B6037
MAENEENRDDDEVAKITQFQELTGIEDLDACRNKLVEHGWDLERAVHDTFNEREGVSGVYNESPPVAPEPELRRRVPVALPTTVRNLRSNQRVFRPRQGSSSAAGTENWSLTTWGMQLIILPFRFISSSLYDVITFILGIFRPDPRRGTTDPVGDVENFIREYNITYGSIHPAFYHGSYSQALNEAKQALKFLIVYIHGDDHADTDTFCRQTLADAALIEFINENSIFWACNVNSGEGYRVSQAHRENTYPFLAIVALKNNRMTVLARVEGLMAPDELLNTLQTIKGDCEMFLLAARVEREEREVTRTLREQQDEAYRESERQDREKAMLRQAERDRERTEMEMRQQEEEARVREIQNREMMKVRWREEMSDEPSSDNPECVKILLKLPSSARIERRFLKTDSLKYLYYFVFCHEDAPDNFDIVTNFPRKILPCKPADDFEPPTFSQEGITRSEMLFVHDKDA